MENLKHTTGEWESSEYAYYLVRCNNSLIANVNSSHRDSIANAKLIAAAPDLINALIEARDLIRREGYGEKHLTLVTINNAINKATK